MTDELKPNVKNLGHDAPTGTARKSKATVSNGLENTVRIMLEENDAIPPTGLFIGVNGKGYLLRPGMEADVPKGVVEVLRNAIMSIPTMDPQTQQVRGYRNQMRYPFSVVQRPDA